MILLVFIAAPAAARMWGGSVTDDFPTLEANGYEVGLLRNPYQTWVPDEDLYWMFVRGAASVQYWIGQHIGTPMVPTGREFFAGVFLGCDESQMDAIGAALAVVMVGQKSTVGATLEQAWAKAKAHWEMGYPNGEAVILGQRQPRPGDCNWGLSFDHGDFVVGAEGLSQHPARQQALSVASYVDMCLTVARHQWEQAIMGHNPATGRPTWVTADGREPEHHSIVRNLEPLIGSIPKRI